jgi:hypothetical protein
MNRNPSNIGTLKWVRLADALISVGEVELRSRVGIQETALSG